MPSDGGNGSRRSTRTAWVAASVAAAIVVVDQVTKAWAVRALADGPVSVIGDSVQLRLSRNTGSAFSLFRGFTPLLALVAVVVVVFLVRAARSTRDLPSLAALALVLGGSVGNLVDRLVREPGFLRGAVVDFVDVGSWPVFNVADAAITTGAVLFVIVVVFGERSRGHAAPGAGPRG